VAVTALTYTSRVGYRFASMASSNGTVVPKMRQKVPPVCPSPEREDLQRHPESARRPAKE
jgi:hypothetical protein